MKLITRLKAVGDLLWGNPASALQSMLVDPSTYRGDQFTNGMWYFGNDGVDRFFSYSDSSSSLNAYNKCPPLAAIITRKAQSYVNGKTWVRDKKGKESDIPEAKKVRKLLVKPNPIQSGKQFEAQWKMYEQMYGYAIILCDKPLGFSNRDAKALWVIPNWMCTVYESDQLFYGRDVKIITGIELKYKNVQTPLPLDNIIIIKDFVISSNSIILPDSRIKPLEMPINNIIGAYESRNVLINKRGPNYLVSNSAKDVAGTIPLTADQKLESQQAFSKYGLRKGQSQAIFTSASLNVSALGFDVGQLKLMEEVHESSMALCDAYGYPPHLLGLIDPTFNNQNSAEKGFYQNTIIPEAEADYEQWNNLFDMESIGLNISKDYSHIYSLQEDALARASARKTRNEALERELRYDLITFNRWRKLNDEEEVPGGDIYFSEWTKTNGDPYARNAGQAATIENTQTTNPDGTTTPANNA